MDKKPLIVVSICASVLLVLGSLSNVVGNENTESCGCGDPPCWPELSGLIGDNEWYLSTVWVTFNGTFNFIYYRVDGAYWINYTEPFILSTNGMHLLEWMCDSNMSDVYSVEIKIDTGHPIILSMERKHVGLFTWQISVNTSDETSGINRVDFGFVQFKHFIDTEPPYQATYRGFWWINFLIISFIDAEPPIEVWDNAGNSLWHPIII